MAEQRPAENANERQFRVVSELLQLRDTDLPQFNRLMNRYKEVASMTYEEWINEPPGHGEASQPE